MKYSMAKYISSIFIVAVFSTRSHAVPITAEDAVSLLPEIPKTENETLAAIVKDPVVQDAVHSIVGEGTLAGLVVKKNVVILPAAEPDVILTQTEQILTAPVSHLEDIRKNITETATNLAKENSNVARIDEIEVAAVIPLNDEGEATAKDDEAPSKETQSLPAASSSIFVTVLPTKEEDATTESTTTVPRVIPLEELPYIETVKPGKKFVVPGFTQDHIQLPEDISPHKIRLPAVIHEQLTAPIVAVLHPKNITGFDQSVIALLPSTTASSILPTETTSPESDHLELTEDRAKKSNGISSMINTTRDQDGPTATIEAVYPYVRKDSLPIEVVSDFQSVEYENDRSDMAVAEDIVFRPLFRYREQQNERTRVIEQRTYRKNSNGPYRRYRPAYRGSYSDYAG